MRRIYFLVPDIDTTKKIVDDLRLVLIEERHIHVIAKRDTPLEDLPEADLKHKSDFIPAIEKGLELGGKTGMLVGLVAIALPPVSTVIAGGILLVATVAGAANLGAWIKEMIGTTIEAHRIKEFEDAIEKGQLLVLADVPADRAEQIILTIKQHLPEVVIEQAEFKLLAS